MTATLTAPKVDKNARRYAAPKDPKVTGKAVGDGPGWVQGYAAVWNNIDLGREVMRRGAFAKSLQESVAAGKVKLMVKHFAYGGDVLDMIGTITEAREDDFGLWFHADFDDDELSQRIREKVVSGKIQKCSVGYRPIRWGFIEMDGKEILEHLECAFEEVTLTLKPMNPLAALTAAKSLDEAKAEVDKLEKILILDPSKVTPEEAERLLKEHFGGRENAESLGKSLKSLLSVMDDLLKQEPQATPPHTATDETKSAGKDAATVDPHSMQEEIALRKAKFKFMASVAKA